MASEELQALNLRAKIIGSLIRQARLGGSKSIEQCAQAIGVPVEIFEGYETGKEFISLPELEGIAFYLDLPLNHFWEAQEEPQATQEERNIKEIAKLIPLRHRMVGAMLRQVRLEAKLSLEELAELAQIEVETLKAYELGSKAVPLPQLELLCETLNRSIREFYDRHGPVGVKEAQQKALQDFMQMPLELQTFVSKPTNRPYLELAVRLSEMSVDRLRAVAEGLLEITY